MKVREYLETLNKYDQVTMIIKRPEYRSEGMGDQTGLTIHQETPIHNVHEWLDGESDVLEKDILAFDFPTLSPVWHNWQKTGRIKVILVNGLPYEISKPSEEFKHRK